MVELPMFLFGYSIPPDLAGGSSSRPLLNSVDIRCAFVCTNVTDAEPPIAARDQWRNDPSSFKRRHVKGHNPFQDGFAHGPVELQQKQITPDAQTFQFS